MRNKKCFWCGEDLRYEDTSREPDACGNQECQRELRRELRGIEEDRQERAREDQYSKY
jgi:transcription initiation factor IIE alpha subunit